MWSAVAKVNLPQEISHLPGKLEGIVSEYGDNFSQGTRQLVCLARALLRASPILLLDEATASVDYETDQIIQKTVREEFNKSTMLVIAHRLNTIIDCDKILVLDDGEVAEFNHPHILLQDSQSIFSFLVNETGPHSSENLREQAKLAYNSVPGN